MKKSEYLRQKKENLREFLESTAASSVRFSDELDRYLQSDTLFYTLVVTVIKPYYERHALLDAVDEFMVSHQIPADELTHNEKRRVARYLELFCRVLLD